MPSFKPARDNADERANSAAFPAKFPLRQTYPRHLSKVMASFVIAAAPAEDSLPLIPPVQVARSVNCPWSTSPPLITSP